MHLIGSILSVIFLVIGYHITPNAHCIHDLKFLVFVIHSYFTLLTFLKLKPRKLCDKKFMKIIKKLKNH